ncbi:pyroglutamyl-peptidase [Altererythrobacter atlanticus]|uniref:Pyrrolidone-carboxylate peptidase n=1 Tax=Croceibacterium atlanticum TaxID=1267766 RepID=A0A0F7KXU1_9SPHN|nr:hypothetical protein [Croceibacterium atlanticum]AKH44061.1 Pyrrolidone-carboxylate peptidase [Croceibacterium atlanticum]MBB5732369.1 pyroglutamyl-peptidase [Croceibacterium atlanticum]
MKEKRAIVTAFRSFPGVGENPSERLLKYLQENTGLLHQSADLQLLETAYAAIQPARDAILADPPDILVMLGYSAMANGFKLECRATSLCSPTFSDARGFRPEQSDDPPDLLHNDTLDFGALAADLNQAGLPAHLSDNAGAYVCNHAYYSVLSHIAEQKLQTRAIFVHIPAISGSALAPISKSSMELADLARGVGVITRHLAEDD